MRTAKKRIVAAGCSVLLVSAAALGAQPLSPVGFCVLSAEEEAGTLAMVDGHDGRLIRRVEIGERPHEVEVSPDARFAYVSQFGITDYDSRIGTPGNRVVKIDLHNGEQVGRFDLPGNVAAPHGVKLRPPVFNELYTNAEAGGDTMLVFDVASHKLLRSFPVPKATHNFVFSPDGRYIFSFAGAEGVAKMDARDGRVLASQKLESPVRGLLLTPSGSVLASAMGEVLELRSDLGIVRRLSAPRPGQYVYLDRLPDGTIVAPSLNDRGVAIFPVDGTPARFVETGKGPIFARLGPDGRIYVANVREEYISVLSAQGTPESQFTGLHSPNGLNFGDCR